MLGGLLTPDRLARVRALAGDIALCSYARHFTLSVPLSTQVCLTIISRAQMGYESIAHEAGGLRAHRVLKRDVTLPWR